MDVLHFIKSYHEEVVCQLEQLDAAHDLETRQGLLEQIGRLLKVYIHLEEQYLYPEIIGLFPGVEDLVRLGEASAATIERQINNLSKAVANALPEREVAWTEQLVALKSAILEHFQLEERTLMPKLRLKLRTEVREDLGQVFLDARHELCESLVGASFTLSSGRKRA